MPWQWIKDKTIYSSSPLFICVIILQLCAYMLYLCVCKILFHLKVEISGFLLWEGLQPSIRLAYQSSSMLVICMGMRYVYNFSCCGFLTALFIGSTQIIYTWENFNLLSKQPKKKDWHVLFFSKIVQSYKTLREREVC